MKIKILALLLCVVCLLSGCSFAGVDPQSLMSPPRPTGEKEKIYEVLEQEAGWNYKLKYPRRGQFRSAIIMDNNGPAAQDEAVVLYQSGEDNSAGITVLFIGYVDGEWQNIGSFTNPATQVDQVQFGDVNGDGVREVIIGWGGTTNGSNEICVYAAQDGKVTEMPLERTYSEFVVTDMDGDGYEEIFTASVTSLDRPANAGLYRARSGALETLSTADLDIEVTQYLSVTAGLINQDQYAIVLDGVKSAGTVSAYVTEILYWNQDTHKLEAPFYDPNTGTANYMRRYTSVVSRDINGDKLLEIPIVTALPGYTYPAPDETCYLTNWYRYQNADDTLERVMSTVINSRENYWFMIPDMWRDKVTVKTDFEARSMTFYEWIPAEDNGQEGAVGAALLKLQVFTVEEWNTGTDREAFTELQRKDNLVYAASIPQPDHVLSLLIQDIENSFELSAVQE